MVPIWLWTKAPSALRPDDYPRLRDAYRFEPVDACPEPGVSGVLVLDRDVLDANRDAVLELVRRPFGTLPVIVLADGGGGAEEEPDEVVFDVVSKPASGVELGRALKSAVQLLESQLSLEASRLAAEQKARQLEELHEIGIALSAERNHERLLELILSKAREITSADAGSLFVVSNIDMPVEVEKGETKRAKGRWLRFRLAQNDSRKLELEEDILAIGPDSIAGYVADTGETLNLEDAYRPPPDKPFAINRSFDEGIQYRTRSMLVVPMQNREGEIIGVLQLINKKTARDVLLDTDASFEESVRAFDVDDERLVRSLASQAAVSIENNHLYVQRERLFTGFMDAAVYVIEKRDPSTQGHSRRVALMTTELARVTNRAERGAYASLRLSDEQVRELKYAALLHDVGKVGVKEQILIKATKLYHGELTGVKQRFKTIRRTLEAQCYRGALEGLLAGSLTKDRIEAMREEMREEIARVEAALVAVEAANKPTVLAHSDFEKLEELARLTYEDVDGRLHPYLTDKEMAALRIEKGSLTPDERTMIEHHVTFTYEFLQRIPWTADLQDVPDLARNHHEKLDGCGYPEGIGGDAIRPQTRMMTIADIYDALTAKDRPYKPAVPTERALDILDTEASHGLIDRDLLDLFIEAQVYRAGLVS